MTILLAYLITSFNPNLSFFPKEHNAWSTTCNFHQQASEVRKGFVKEVHSPVIDFFSPAIFLPVKEKRRSTAQHLKLRR